MNALWLVEDQATTSGSTVFIKLSFHSDGSSGHRFLSIHCCGVNFYGGVPNTHFSFCSLCFLFYVLFPFSLSLPPHLFFLNCFIVLFFYIFIQYGSRRFPGSFSLIISPNSGFSFFYVSSMAFFLKRRFRRHACISTQK